MAKRPTKSHEVDLNTMNHELKEETVETISEENITEENITEEITEEKEVEETKTEESPAEVETTGPETINGIVTNSIHVKVRRGPSLESDPIEVLRNGDKVTIFGEENGFYKISTSLNNNVYISKDFVMEEKEG